ncbi:hypothetical protein [Pedobacter sp. Leaf194]|uniref:hypothetical protein n=1 Tax=Pedobacter sp. Leaf194 TaxID=1736297 RepID=UPI000703BEC4|nr:hypothetical protein [Pedobacter sp. Leaf194]KQS36160.1 hypothetical protein ASG14_12060 [Pedobacter sp. Leaf194]
MNDTERVRLYLTEELKDSTRALFSLNQISKDCGLAPDDLTLVLKQLVSNKVITVFEPESPDGVFIELQL